MNQTLIEGEQNKNESVIDKLKQVVENDII